MHAFCHTLEGMPPCAGMTALMRKVIFLSIVMIMVVQSFLFQIYYF